MELDPKRCCKIVTTYDNGWPRGQHQCYNKVTFVSKGSGYCGRHSPKAEAAREKKSMMQFDYDRTRRSFGFVGIPLYDALAELVTAITEGASPVYAVKEAKKLLKQSAKERKLIHKGRPR